MWRSCKFCVQAVLCWKAAILDSQGSVNVKRSLLGDFSTSAVDIFTVKQLAALVLIFLLSNFHFDLHRYAPLISIFIATCTLGQWSTFTPDKYPTASFCLSKCQKDFEVHQVKGSDNGCILGLGTSHGALCGAMHSIRTAERSGAKVPKKFFSVT